jgi:hypothetical protein
MKRFYILAIFLLGLAMAQTANGQQTQGKYPILRERLANAKFDYIKEKLALTDAQTEQFRPVYMAYDKEQAQIGKLKNLRMDNVNADSLSADEAQRLITARLEFAQKQLDLRKKYSVEFQKVITPQQLIKLQQAEMEIRQKVLMELRNRNMNQRLQKGN